MKTNKTVSTRNQAMIWWDTLPVWGNPSKEYYMGLYYSDDDVTPERIEEIWKSEIAERGITITNISKPNQKQFVNFNESLFKAYIDKLPESESLNMIKIIYENKLPDCKFKAHLDKWFKL